LQTIYKKNTHLKGPANMKKNVFLILAILFGAAIFACAKPGNYKIHLDDPQVTESPVALKTLSGTISGTLTMPKSASGKIPVVLIVQGSGPTDRDGNGPNSNTNTFKLMAYALGDAGIASLRYDKRLIGQSISTTKESELTIDDYVDDAVSLIGMLNDDGRFSKIILAGHGEGSLAGMMACYEEPVKAFISLEGAGQPAEKILDEQMKLQPPFVAAQFETIMDSLKKGKINPNVDPSLYSIARPALQRYIMSWCRYDPTKEIKKIKMPVLILQGTTDLKVKTDNATKLKIAKSNATLVIIKGMNYILKDAPADKDQNMATYDKPDLPLNAELVSTMNDFIKGLN
jgi:pimeloyl-ACP methyl ester carboxylesterase